MKASKKIESLQQSNNIWKHVHNTFHPYTPAFKGLTKPTGIIKEHQAIADTLADHYETHFEKPNPDPNNQTHLNVIEDYESIQQLPKQSIGKITLAEVTSNWKKASKKKSTDSEGLSAFLLSKLSTEYLQILTIAFNKVAESGNVLQLSKHAKVICLSKDGVHPEVNKLRPISLLSNIGKIFERIVHTRILKWCSGQGIYTDEQSRFTPGRRLRTRILSLIEDLRLTTAANNRPALVIFVEFMTAFDKMWHPALLSTLRKLGFPVPPLRWINMWLHGRTMSIHVGEAVSRSINISVGTPQGSVLAATLFRLHVHALPSFFMNLTCHLFADDLAIVMTGALENKFSINISELEKQAVVAMTILAKYAENNLLPVNTNKTKAHLVHSVVAPPYPKVEYNGKAIQFVKRFKYLGIDVTTKLGWGTYLETRLRKVKQIYNALRILFKDIPVSLIQLRRKLFFAYALPHLIWLFPCWFFYTELQQRRVEHVYCAGLRIVYNLNGWDDLTTYILAREFTLNDYIYKYWTKFNKHLENANEAFQYQMTFNAYLFAKTPHKSWYRRQMSYYSNTDPCAELRNVLHRSLLSLGCPHVPSLPTSTFLMTTNTNLKVVLWLLGELDSDLAQRLHATRSSNSIAFIKDFFFETAMFPRSFILRLDDIFNSSSLVDLHQLSNILSYYVHKPIVGHNVQLGLIEYLSELVVCLRNPPMTIHQDMWGNRDVLNMFEQLPMDEAHLAIDSRILEYTDGEQQQQQQSSDDEQTSADLKDVFGQVRTELLAQTTNDMNETEFETVFTNEQINDIDKQLQNALADTHQFFKRLETGAPNLSTSMDQQSSFLLSNETLQKLTCIASLNETYEHVRSNDKVFLDKIQSLLNDIDKENDSGSKPSTASLTLQSQVMLARNLAHTLSNNDQILKK